MKNPWERIKATDYESHMMSIHQHEPLNLIFKEQINKNEPSDIVVLGIGCGNGLEHIKPKTKVYGYDINQDFLNKCRSRVQNENGEIPYELNLYKIDLTESDVHIPHCDLLICNLVLEFLDFTSFIRLIRKSQPKLISIVFQLTNEITKAISESPFALKFKDVATIRKEIEPKQLTLLLNSAGYVLKDSKTYDIDQTKYFIRMDFRKDS